MSEEKVAVPQGMGGWMTFVGIMTIIGGALSILSCFGIPSGILMLIAGIALLGARTALRSITAIDPVLLPFFQKIKTFMQMQGIVFIISLVIGTVLFAVYFTVIMAALASEFGRQI